MSSTLLKSIGKIIRPRGLQGEVFVKPWDKEASWLKNIDIIFIVDSKGRVLESAIESARWQKHMLVVKLKDISNRTEAEAVQGSEIKVDSELLPKLEEDEFYIEDLINLTVKSLDSDRKLGKIKDVLSSDAGDFLEIEPDEVTESVLVPFKDVFVPKIDHEEYTIFITGLDDLFKAE